MVTYAARQAAVYALQAAGDDIPADPREPPTHPRASLAATEQVALEHASASSVWLQNSVRGAAGLAIAVYVAQRTGLQHGVWVVLGTLSVLRSNALGTGWSILSALAGTAVGIVAGALLVIGIGTHQTVLWAVLPLALLLAAYAPRAISFAAGQAGFTVVLFVLFNIIAPVGWRVGEVRVEDVAIGFAISLAVGLLFWPRGAAAALRRDLADAYATGADYVVATARQLFESRVEAATAEARRVADAAIHRLDDAFRQYLTERSATTISVEEVGALVGGASRLRRAGESLTDLQQMVDGAPQLESCGQNLNAELYALQAWYLSFGYAIVNRRRVPPPHIRDTAGRERLLTCLGEASLSPEPATEKAALVLLWASQHLDSLWELETHLDERANALSDGPGLGQTAFGRTVSGHALFIPTVLSRTGLGRRRAAGPPTGADRRAPPAQPLTTLRARRPRRSPAASASGLGGLRRNHGPPPELVGRPFVLDRPPPAGPNKDADPEEDDRKQDHEAKPTCSPGAISAVAPGSASRPREVP